jgi:hemin uptake protein HemP
MADAPESDNDDPATETPGNLAGRSVREPARTIRSEDLFAGARAVCIEHAGERYRLLITRNDRLILQK